MDNNYITRLRRLLAAGPLSQSELAGRLGVTFAALNRWLNGHASPRPAKLKAIEKLYRERVGYPSITEAESSRVTRRADRFRITGLWEKIAGNEKLQEDLLLEHTYNSTAIEGTTFTKNETKMVIFGKTAIPGKSLVEHLEVTNHAAVLRGVFRGRYPKTVTEALIRQLHQDLMQGIREDAGDYSKRRRVIAGVHIALTHPKDIPEEMRGLLADWRREPAKKTLREIGRFHARFELIHPFADGNGRVGRLVMAIQCMGSGLPPVVIENARKAEYYDVLEYAQRKSEWPFIGFLADEMERTGQILRKHLRVRIGK